MRSIEEPTIRIAKEFHWEMGHRLPFHQGGCRNLHGHSYRMIVEIEGTLDRNSMVLDYFELKTMVQPIVDKLDHSFLCDSRDETMLAFFKANPLKHTVVPFLTTAENLAGWFLDEIIHELKPFPNIMAVGVRLYETESSWAERGSNIRPQSAPEA